MKQTTKDGHQRLPDWLRQPIQTDANYAEVQQLLRKNGLHTVCEDAKCPNRHECWNRGTATVMILGNICTRDCRFCSVATGQPDVADGEEPQRVADAVSKMNLKHVVITSVTRDDLPDGGSAIFAETIRAVRRTMPQTTIEVLTPDFQGNKDQLYTVLDARPDVFNHNIETIERLQEPIRSGATYQCSMTTLRNAAEYDGGSLLVKSGIMLGLGEEMDEVIQTLKDLRDAGCRLLSIGQYMAPSRHHWHTKRFVPPTEFEELEKIAYDLGFSEVASGPLVRSSYRAEQLLNVDKK